MELIDCTKRCTEKSIKKLLSKLQGTTSCMIMINEEDLVTLEYKESLDVFKDNLLNKVATCTDYDVISFVLDDTNFVFSMLFWQYQKWCSSYYVERLLEISTDTQDEEQSTVKAVKADQTKNVRVAYETDNVISEIVEFSGSNAQCIEFINKYHAMYSIRSFMKAKVVVSIDSGDWKTLDELEKEGVLILK